MTEPTDLRMNQKITVDGQPYSYHFVNTGVEHVVIEVDGIEGIDVQMLGASIRHNEAFSPRGTNVNFIHLTQNNTVHVRTYERGVEAETPACGTGMVASGLVAGILGKVESPVTILPASGDELQVGFKLTENNADDVTLYGPAVHVFQGTLHYSE